MTDTSVDSPNWVDRRGRCTPKSKFKELFEAVKFDVKEANKVPPDARFGQLFEVNKIKDNQFKVRRYPEESPPVTFGCVTFALQLSNIEVCLPGSSRFCICSSME